MNIGYARVSTEEQNLDLQRQALEAAQSGDVFVVWKLDRLGRSLPHLVEVIKGLREAGVGFRSLQEQIETTTVGGRFYLDVLAASAEFEREVISDRTKADMATAVLLGVDVATLRPALCGNKTV